MRSVFIRWVVAWGVVCLLSSSSKGDIDPRGVFFHSYTGSFSANEWIHIWDLEGENRYRFSDIRGLAPYDGEILPDGQITWDTLPSQSGSGMFTSPDDVSQTLYYQGGTFPSTLRRAPGTDASFITRIDSREQGSETVGGQWDVLIERLSASTGELLSSESLSMTTVVDGDMLRIEQEDGVFYQGVFETGDTAGFRVVGNPSGGSEYGSFAGSATSLNRDLLGDFRMAGADSFTATMLIQDRRPPGSQIQTVYRFTGSRVPAPGTVVVAGIALVGCGRRRRPSSV